MLGQLQDQKNTPDPDQVWCPKCKGHTPYNDHHNHNGIHNHSSCKNCGCIMDLYNGIDSRIRSQRVMIFIPSILCFGFLILFYVAGHADYKIFFDSSFIFILLLSLIINIFFTYLLYKQLLLSKQVKELWPIWATERNYTPKTSANTAARRVKN